MGSPWVLWEVLNAQECRQLCRIERGVQCYEALCAKSLTSPLPHGQEVQSPLSAHHSGKELGLPFLASSGDRSVADCAGILLDPPPFRIGQVPEEAGKGSQTSFPECYASSKGGPRRCFNESDWASQLWRRGAEVKCDTCGAMLGILHFVDLCAHL